MLSGFDDVKFYAVCTKNAKEDFINNTWLETRQSYIHRFLYIKEYNDLWINSMEWHRQQGKDKMLVTPGITMETREHYSSWFVRLIAPKC